MTFSYSHDGGYSSWIKLPESGGWQALNDVSLFMVQQSLPKSFPLSKDSFRTRYAVVCITTNGHSRIVKDGFEDKMSAQEWLDSTLKQISQGDFE